MFFSCCDSYFYGQTLSNFVIFRCYLLSENTETQSTGWIIFNFTVQQLKANIITVSEQPTMTVRGCSQPNE